MMRIKKNDMVVVLTGKDRGKRGQVLEVRSKDGKVKIAGIAIVTRHVKARRQGEVSMIKREEGFINSSNVMPVCPVTSKPCRTNFVIAADGNKVRVSNRSKEAF